MFWFLRLCFPASQKKKTGSIFFNTRFHETNILDILEISSRLKTERKRNVHVYFLRISEDPVLFICTFAKLCSIWYLSSWAVYFAFAKDKQEFAPEAACTKREQRSRRLCALDCMRCVRLSICRQRILEARFSKSRLFYWIYDDLSVFMFQYAVMYATEVRGKLDRDR